MAESNMTLLKKRSAINTKLKIFKNYFYDLKVCKNLTDVQIFELKCRLGKFEPLLNEFDTLQNEIVTHLNRLTESDDYEQRAQFENVYYPLLASASVLITCMSSVELPNKINNTLCLPEVDLPRFSGDYQHWLEFKENFESLIHNNESIDDITKLRYLRASLKGKAAHVIEGNSTYEIEWNHLCENYNNRRLLIDRHIHALFSVIHIEKESSSAIRNLVNVINKNVRALTSLKLPTQHWDTLIIFMMSTKLDSVSARYWAEHECTMPSLPTLKQFISFLNERADLLETIERRY